MGQLLGGLLCAKVGHVWLLAWCSTVGPIRVFCFGHTRRVVESRFNSPSWFPPGFRVKPEERGGAWVEREETSGEDVGE